LQLTTNFGILQSPGNHGNQYLLICIMGVLRNFEVYI